MPPWRTAAASCGGYLPASLVGLDRHRHALALCAANDPSALVALRVGWAMRVDLARTGLTRTGQDVALEEPSEYR